jgi:hypothetical protein
MIEMNEIKPNRTTYVFFGGLQGQMAIPWFEFKGVSAHIGDFNKVFIRDLSQTWYHGTYKDTIREISSLVRKIGNNTRLIFVGNSMGGYAAYLFGYIFGVDEVIMFSPQTAIDLHKKVKLWDDPSFEAYLNITRKISGVTKIYFDLAKIRSRADVHVYYCSKNRCDSLHANNLRGDFINTHPIGEDGHNVVSILLHRDKLIPILRGKHL